jgi:hypothetical protein
MKKLMATESGFIPMMLTLIAVLVAVIVVVYLRVARAHK